VPGICSIDTVGSSILNGEMTSQTTKEGRRKESRLLRAAQYSDLDTTDPDVEPPPGSVLADHAALSHNNTHSRFPRFYVDQVVICRNCGTEEIWPANRQKWWYEVAKGNINTTAILCRKCRGKDET